MQKQEHQHKRSTEKTTYIPKFSGTRQCNISELDK